LLASTVEAFCGPLDGSQVAERARIGAQRLVAGFVAKSCVDAPVDLLLPVKVVSRKRMWLFGATKRRAPVVQLEDFVLSSTVIAPDKIAAYNSTAYSVEVAGLSFVLRINEPSLPLRRIYASTGAQCALFITAFNPYGCICDAAVNEDAHHVLGARLAALTPHVLEGAGRDIFGKWPAEKSFLALGITRDLARQLGVEFGQDAIVWCGIDAVPELVLLR
jgi:hypothetical protein